MLGSRADCAACTLFRERNYPTVAFIYGFFTLVHVGERFLGRKSIKHIDSKGHEEESNLQFALKRQRPWSQCSGLKAWGPTNKHTPTHNNHPLDINGNIIIMLWNIGGSNHCEQGSIVVSITCRRVLGRSKNINLLRWRVGQGCTNFEIFF